MIDLDSVNKIYLANGYTDLRKGIDGYISLVEGMLKLTVYDGSIFIFCNKQKDKLKILQYEDGCFWLYYKRMDKRKIIWPRQGVKSEVTKTGILRLLNGLIYETSSK